MTETEFVRQAEPLRRELLAYCYRLSGSVQDAEDLVQEAMLRGWRAYDGFRGEASVRTWLYRIATNAFLSGKRRRRHLPSDLGPPATDVSLDAMLDEDVAWLEPLPDALVAADADPERKVVDGERLRLALTAALQRLPPRQRCALLLREALDCSAAEIGELLGVSGPAAKSLLQRARATLGAIDERPDGTGDTDDTGDTGDADDTGDTDAPTADRLLEAYARAFETADVGLLERTLHDDAMLEMTPARTWFSGRATCLPYLALVIGEPGDWSARPTRANGQPAAVAYRHGQPFAVVVLGVRDGSIGRISLFGDPAVIERFLQR